jgi:hypothetical protein
LGGGGGWTYVNFHAGHGRGTPLAIKVAFVMTECGDTNVHGSQQAVKFHRLEVFVEDDDVAKLRGHLKLAGPDEMYFERWSVVGRVV